MEEGGQGDGDSSEAAGKASERGGYGVIVSYVRRGGRVDQKFMNKNVATSKQMMLFARSIREKLDRRTTRYEAPMKKE